MFSCFFFSLSFFLMEGSCSTTVLYNCVDLCHTSAWISHRCTCVPGKPCGIGWEMRRGFRRKAAVHGVAKSDMTERLHFRSSLSCIGEGNGNPLQCSCLENPRDGGPWWAAVYGVTQSWTRLKRLSIAWYGILTGGVRWYFIVNYHYLKILHNIFQSSKQKQEQKL